MSTSLVWPVSPPVSGDTSDDTSITPSTMWVGSTPGDLLVAWCVSNNPSTGSFPVSISGTGWELAISGGGGYNWIGLWYKPDCGSSESAPSFSDSGATIMSCGAAEFSGVATSSPLDQTGWGNGSPASASAADSAASNLVIGLSAWNGANTGDTVGLTLHGSAGGSLSTTMLQDNSGADGPQFYAFGCAGNNSSLGANANGVSSTSSLYENYPNLLVASFLAA